MIEISAVLGSLLGYSDDNGNCPAILLYDYHELRPFY